MSASKFTHQLKDYLQNNTPQQAVEVVIELCPVKTDAQNPGLSRSEKIAQIKQDFQKELEPVEKLIVEQGGDVLGAAWLNQTVKAKLPAGSLGQLAQLKEVTAIDLPHQLTRD